MSKVPMRPTGKSSHDIPKSDQLMDFMSQGWAPSPLDDVRPARVVPFASERRQKLSALFLGVRLVIPSGTFKVRSNDTDYKFRPHSAFAWLTGMSAVDAIPDSVLILEPTHTGHESLLFIHPRSPRDTSEFHSDRRHGEFWIGRRLALEEAQVRYGIPVRHIDTLENYFESRKNNCDSVVLRGHDPVVDSLVEKHKKREPLLLSALSELRLKKDSYEIEEIQRAVDVTIRGFDEMVSSIQTATSVPNGERVIETVFFGRARLEGNDVGYDTIAASGSHACVLHWTRNDGEVRPGDLILIDAGIELDSFYTADITRTIPVNGKFSPEQRMIYQLVYEAQQAGIAAIKPGLPWITFHNAAMAVLAAGLEKLGVLPGTAEDSLLKENGFHRRWTVHSTGHMLGIDVHDCAQARQESYREGVLEEGMVLTVEPGLYIQPDDQLFPEKFRGIGVRIEDDILVTANGAEVLSKALPSHPDEVEAWVGKLLG